MDAAASSEYDLILAGAGHAHLGVLRQWSVAQRPSGRIALVSPTPHSWYAPRLPGLLAGRYTPAQCQIELAALCRAAKVELLIGQVEQVDPDGCLLVLGDGRTLRSQWLSLDVGSALLAPPQQGTQMQVLASRPIDDCLPVWQGWQQEPRRLAILGGTPQAVELALALAGRVPSLALFCGGPLLAGHSLELRLRSLGYLRQRGVQVREHCPVGRIDEDWLLSGDEPVWRGRRLLLASGARGWPWLASSGLLCDAEGFVVIQKTLQSRSHPRVFAAGECASLPDVPRSLSRSSRQGRVLALNLAAALNGRAMRTYRVPRRAPSLMATADGGALLGWGQWSADGRWLGRCKDWLDERFILRHRLD